MVRRAPNVRWIVCLVAGSWIAVTGPAFGRALDERGEISLGVRTYASARIGTEHTDISIIRDDAGNQLRRSLTFPVSADGHLRQNRYYVEAEFDHDLRRLVQTGFGPLALLKDLPFKLRKFKYHLVYRGEGEGIYDLGPREYRTAEQFFDTELVPCRGTPRPDRGNCPNAAQFRRRLRRIGVQRHRLFQAFIEAQVGNLVTRFGRQILVWGETDAFRLLDNINPIDNSFGGFLISLDERRVPLDMLLGNYYLGEIGPLTEAYVEAFVAIDDAVGFDPGIPEGSPWSLPNLGDPSASLKLFRETPERTFEDARGGVQIKFNAPLPGIGDGTFGFAHYYTYFDTPALQTFVAGQDSPPQGFGGDDIIFPLGFPPGHPAEGFLAFAVQSAPKVQVTGATGTFTVPSQVARSLGLSGEPVIRTELAYFHREPRFSQGNLDPFVYATGQCHGPGGRTDDREDFDLCTGGRRLGDSWNFVLGIDTNQWIRALNPRQTFFITTQFFYKHLNAAVKRKPICVGGECTGDASDQVIATNGEVLPVPEFDQWPAATGLARDNGSVQSILIHHPVDQYLQTLLITTSYYSGQVTPSLLFFYDWGGAFVAAPSLTFSRDPFRFTVSYNYLNASRLKGGSGVSLLRDRDNFLVQLEYVI